MRWVDPPPAPYIGFMAVLKPDIRQIADEDPRMRALLAHKDAFFYKDWKAFRERDFHGIVERLGRRAERSATGFLWIGGIYLATKAGLLAWSLLDASTTVGRLDYFDAGLGFLYGVMMIGFGLFLRRKTQEIRDMEARFEGSGEDA